MEQPATQRERRDNAAAGLNGDDSGHAVSLRQSLARWSSEFTARGRARWPGILRDPAFRPRRAIAAAKAVTERFENVKPKPPSPYDIEELHRRVRESWTRHASLDHLSGRDLWRLPWVLFYTPESAAPWSDVGRTSATASTPAGAQGMLPGLPEAAGTPSAARSWLGADPRLVPAYGRWLAAERRALPALALLHEFLSVYPVGLPTFDDLRRVLSTSIMDGDSPSTRRWRRRCRDFSLLDEGADLAFVRTLVTGHASVLGPTEAPSRRPPPAREEPRSARSADESERQSEPVMAAGVGGVLRRAGFDGKLARCEFLKSGALGYLAEIDRRLRQGRVEPARLDRLLAFLECENQLRFDERSMRTAIAAALLGPFLDRPPDAETQQRLQAFFLRRFGDPRLPSKRRRWSSVPDAVKHVLIRWLVKQTLDEFFRLLDETALDRHWRYREAFWKAYFRQDLIDDAWFALGADATRLLKRIQDHRESTTAALRGAQGNQSVLLLRMSAGVTVAEWSHNGSCRIWRDGNRSAPLLYRSDYSGSDLRNGSDLSQRHDGSEYGRWQDEIARWLRDHTGASVERRAYMAAASR